jgi:polysaccharide export outer membrane protein
MNRQSTAYLFSATILIATIISCTRYKDMVILQSRKGENNNIYNAIPPPYKIQKRDVLYIQVLSLNQEITQVINSTSTTNSTQLTSDASMFIYGNIVSDSGYVELPVIGKINVIDKTLEEAKIEIGKQASVFLKDATIIVKLISFKFSVLGEVKSPGVYQNFNNQLTVLEAIGKAGDITPYGNRHKILVVRPGTEGTKTFRLDITRAEILNSEGFFLLPNDIIYVEPVKSYNFKVNIQNISLLLTGISTLILVLNYIRISNP